MGPHPAVAAIRLAVRRVLTDILDDHGRIPGPPTHEHERGGGPLVGREAAGRPAVFGEDVVQDAADRQAYRRDRRMGTHVRFPS